MVTFQNATDDAADKSRLELFMTIRYTKADVADIIEQFLDGSGDRWDWDDLTSTGIVDPQLDAIRLRCIDLYDGAAQQGTAVRMGSARCVGWSKGSALKLDHYPDCRGLGFVLRPW